MSPERIVFTFAAVPPSAVDARLLGYLQALSSKDCFAKQRFRVALCAFWYPHALELEGATGAIVRYAAALALSLGQKQRQFVAATCGVDSTGLESFGSHLLDPELDRHLSVPGRLQKPPGRFRLSFEELRRSELGVSLAYLAGFNKSERLLKVLQPLRTFWYPLACRYYGWEGEDLARVARTCLADLQQHEENLALLFGLGDPLPTSLPPSEPMLSTPVTPDFEDSSDLEENELDLLPEVAGESNGHREGADVSGVNLVANWD